MEFSIDIHYLHSAFLTGEIVEDVKMSSERYCFSELEKYIMSGNVGIVQNYFGT